jgi:hypothetical protein
VEERGRVELGGTVAIILILAAWLISEQMQWWDAWPWWGKTLFVLGAIVTYAIGVSWEGTRRPGAASSAEEPPK